MSQKLGPETRAIIDAIRERERKGNLNYLTMTIDLGTARTGTEYILPGTFDHMSVLRVDGAASIKLNKNTNDSIDLTWVRRIDTVFNRFYLTNIAQTGKTLQLQIGGDASFTLDSDLAARMFAEIQRQNWLADGTYTERWEQGFRKILYHGRTGAFFKTEGITNIPFDNCTPPPILAGVNTMQVAPWNDAINMRNSIDGVTMDEVYVGFPKAHMRMIMRFDAMMPALASLGLNDAVCVGFETNSAGGFCIAYLLGWNGAYQLYIKLFDNVTGLMVVTVAVVTLPVMGAFDTLYLIWNHPFLTLTDGTAILGRVMSFGKTNPGKMIPFVANESATNIVTDFQVGQVQVFEIEELRNRVLGSVSQAVSTNAMVSALKISPDFYHKLVIHLKEHATNDVCYQIRASNDDVTYFTILNYTLLPTSGVDFQTLTDPWQYIDVQIMDAVSGTHGKVDITIGGS